MQIQKRKSAKIQMKCNKCQGSCSPQGGDWYEGTTGQIFLCRECEISAKAVKVGPRNWGIGFRSAR